MRPSGARVAFWFSRRLLRSKLIEDAPIPALEDLSRLLTSGICSSSRNLVDGRSRVSESVLSSYPFFVGIGEGLISGTLYGAFHMHFCLGGSFHGTLSVSSRDYYDLIGASKNASASDIKKAYYVLAKKLHPETNKDDADAERKFQDVQRGYEVLKDEDKRRLYDQVGPDAFEQAASGGGPGGPFGVDLAIHLKTCLA